MYQMGGPLDDDVLEIMHTRLKPGQVPGADRRLIQVAPQHAVRNANVQRVFDRSHPRVEGPKLGR